MEESPEEEEANNRSLSQKIPRLFWDPMLNYRVHNSPPLVPILSQKNQVHTLPSYFPNSNPNIILLYRPRSSEWSFPFIFFDQNIVCISHLSHACYTPLQPHFPRFHYPSNILWNAQVTKFLVLKSSQPTYNSSSLIPNILPCTLFVIAQSV
jgi:hypothetical protein